MYIPSPCLHSPPLENVRLWSLPLSLLIAEIDTKSIETATMNVRRNNLGDRIRILTTIQDAPLLPLNLSQIESLDFCMCNPPFYHDADELYRHAKIKAVEPFSVYPIIALISPVLDPQGRCVRQAVKLHSSQS
jgi:23S rRNA A1618 N6-methylase RlmF